jgi:phenylpropionate dioxygenase-like ring-hydroxylating dioxygenase large terminal subunit
MQRTRQIALAKRVLAHRAAGNTTDLAATSYQIDPSIYFDPDHYERELELIFRRQPLLACMSCDVKEPGDFFTTSLVDVPVIIVRGADGQVRAFRNSCRHRGALLADGRGHAKNFSCPFHRWTYGTDGTLKATTHEQGFCDLDPEQSGLAELACAEAAGLVFVRLSGAEEPLDATAWLSGLAEEFADLDYSSYHALPRPAAAAKANWKLLFDGSCENYHVSHIHRKTIHPLIESSNATFDEFGMHSLAVYPRKTVGQLSEIAEDQWDLLPHASCTYLIFPNTVLINMVDHVELFQIYPETPNTCRVHTTLYTPTPSDDERSERHWRRQAEALELTVRTEDLPISEGIQRALKPGAPPLTYGRNEPALIHYHRSLAQVTAQKPPRSHDHTPANAPIDVPA